MLNDQEMSAFNDFFSAQILPIYKVIAHDKPHDSHTQLTTFFNAFETTILKYTEKFDDTIWDIKATIFSDEILRNFVQKKTYFLNFLTDAFLSSHNQKDETLRKRILKLFTKQNHTTIHLITELAKDQRLENSTLIIECIKERLTLLSGTEDKSSFIQNLLLMHPALTPLIKENFLTEYECFLMQKKLKEQKIAEERRAAKENADFERKQAEEKADCERKQKEEELKKPKKTIIVGMGPAGLTAAFVLATKRHDILLIENREAYTREQRLYMPEELILFLLKNFTTLEQNGLKIAFDELHAVNITLPERSDIFDQADLQFFLTIAEKNRVMPLMAIENFLERKLSLTVNSQEKFFLHSLTQSYNAHKGKLSHNTITEDYFLGKITVLRGSQYNVQAIDGNKKTMVLRDNKSGTTQTHHFDYFIAADGRKHKMADLLSTSGPDFAFTYASAPLRQTRHQASGLIVLKCKKEHTVHINALQLRDLVSPHHHGSSQIAPKHLSVLKQYGWDKDYLPFFYIQYDHDQQRFYFAGEIPSEILGETLHTKEEKLEKWAKLLISIEFDCQAFSAEHLELASISSAQYPNHTSVAERVSTFSLNPEIANRHYCPLPGDGGFFLIGDAFLAANFHLGHGVTNAIEDALNLKNYFRERDLLLDSYSQNCIAHD